MERFCSKSTLGIGGAAGAMRGYDAGDCSVAERTTGGIQLAAFLVRRCRPGSGDICLCKVFTLYAEGLARKQYRVATLMVSEHTASTAIRAQKRLRRGLPGFVSRSNFRLY